jgi:hypothetical protein
MAQQTPPQPTAVPELNAVLHELVAGTQAILADNFVAASLQGSLAMGDWDSHSDVDFIIAIRREVTAVELVALQTLHGRIHELPSVWARRLDGSYFPLPLLAHTAPAGEELLYLDNGSRELVRSSHDNTLVVRWVLREHGLALAGPPAGMLIPAITAAALQQEVRATMREWATEIFDGRYRLDNRWGQSFTVLSYCRMLHTLATGRIESKLAAVRWTAGVLDGRWQRLIARAWAERADPAGKVWQVADPDEVAQTLALSNARSHLATGMRMVRPQHSRPADGH